MNALLKNQNSQIRLQRQKIISSLNYAKKIQRSIMVPEELIRSFFPQSFIFFKPKDIVSGDFYWFKKTENQLILATVDCTGHGVPGAFMSLIANSQLEKAVTEKNLSDPGDIMKFVHYEIMNLLNQDRKLNSAQDGLDISICLINHKSNTIRFAGSGNAIYLVKDEEMTELKTENFGLAGDFFAKRANHHNAFLSKEIRFESGTDLFMFTDGYLDQFGGKDKKKMNKSRFKDMLLSLSKNNLHNAQVKCEQFFEGWRGSVPQLDDVLVIGARL
jgi:serine phosphatase RsbU (regulator of sigma subunit)